MKFLFSLSGGITAALLIAGAAQAKVGDKAWAQCAWENDPVAAAAWIDMPIPEWKTDREAPELLLGYRLAAGCSEEIAEETKTNRSPNWKSMKSRLKRAMPASVSADSVDPSIFLCRNYEDDELFLHEIVRKNEADPESIAYRTFFASHMGRPVRLPQDLRVIPAEGTQLSRECLLIDASGKLVENMDDLNA